MLRSMALTNAERSRRYRARNREKYLESQRQANRTEARKASVRKWREKNAEHWNGYLASYNRSPARKQSDKMHRKKFAERIKARRKTPESRKKFSEYMRLYRRKLKEEVVAGYGGKCVCCGESELLFLTIDHIDGMGLHANRGTRSRTNKPRDFSTTTKFYFWLKKNGFPKDHYRLLCVNCNFAIGRFGYCPHRPNDKYLCYGQTKEP